MRYFAVILLAVSFIGAAYVASGRPPVSFLTSQVGVGLGATVPANPYNTLAEQLTDWQGALDERERALDERERTLQEGQERLQTILGTAVLIIAMLLGLNFYLDWHRSSRHRGRRAEDGGNESL